MLHTYSTMPCPSRGSAAVLVVVLLPRDRSALPVEPVVRLHSLARREDTSVHTVADDRPMQPTLARRESPYLGPREGPTRDTLPNPAGLGDLAVLDAGFGCERHPRAER